MEQLAKADKIIKDNILINSDYKSGIINQSGHLGYAANNGYTIDMWQVQGSGAITIKDRIENESGKIVVFWKNNNIDGEARFRQIVTKNKKGTFTFSIYIVTCTEDVKMYIMDDDGNIYSKKIKKGLNNMVFCGKIKEVGLLTSELSGSCYIDFMKLEEGKIYTGMPLWDCAIETLKCKRYFQVINHRIILPQFYMNQYVGFSLETEMENIPTVKNIQLLDTSDTSITLSGGISMTNGKHVDKVWTPTTYTKPFVIISKAVFDGYNY